MSSNTGTAVDAARADVLILGGQVIDGSGSEPFAADVAVTDGKIAAVGSLGAWSAARTIRADGLYVTPGFVDMHTHSERGLYIPELAPSLPYLTQGVTTVVGGADGYGSWPLHETMDAHAAKLERQGIGTNAVLMVGAGQVAATGHGYGGACSNDSRTGGHEGLRAGGDGERRVGAVVGPGVSAGAPRRLSGDHRAGRRGGRLRGHVSHPHAQRGRPSCRSRCRGHRDRGALRGPSAC